MKKKIDLIEFKSDKLKNLKIVAENSALENILNKLKMVRFMC